MFYHGKPLITYVRYHISHDITLFSKLPPAPWHAHSTDMDRVDTHLMSCGIYISNNIIE